MPAHFSTSILSLVDRGFVYASDAIADFVRGLDRADSVAVYTFSRNMTRASELTRDRGNAIIGLRKAVAGDDAVFVRLLAPSNGPLLGNTSPGGFGFTPAKVFGITYTFTAPGTYILRARVINGPSAPNPSGLLLEGQLQ